jgi:hypothetical protein
MEKEAMAACAQLSQFDEELYKVSGEGGEKYAIHSAAPQTLRLRIPALLLISRSQVLDRNQ